MQLLRPTSTAPKTSLIYVTVGTLTMVWTAVYFIYRLTLVSEGDPVHYFWIAGLMATGLALLIIGLATGPITQAASPAVQATPPQVLQVVPANAQPANNQAAPSAAPVVPPAPVAAVSAAPGGGNGQAMAKTSTV